MRCFGTQGQRGGTVRLSLTFISVTSEVGVPPDFAPNFVICTRDTEVLLSVLCLKLYRATQLKTGIHQHMKKRHVCHYGGFHSICSCASAMLHGGSPDVLSQPVHLEQEETSAMSFFAPSTDRFAQRQVTLPCSPHQGTYAPEDVSVRMRGRAETVSTMRYLFHAPYELCTARSTPKRSMIASSGFKPWCGSCPCCQTDLICFKFEILPADESEEARTPAGQVPSPHHHGLRTSRPPSTLRVSFCIAGPRQPGTGRVSRRC